MMAIKVLITADEMVTCLLNDISEGISINSYGDRLSDYHSFVEDENENCVCVNITEEKEGLASDKCYYSVHLIDDITGKDAEIFSTRDLSRESLLELVDSLIKNTLREIEGS